MDRSRKKHFGKMLTLLMVVLLLAVEVLLHVLYAKFDTHLIWSYLQTALVVVLAVFLLMGFRFAHWLAGALCVLGLVVAAVVAVSAIKMEEDLQLGISMIVVCAVYTFGIWAMYLSDSVSYYYKHARHKEKRL